MPRSTSTCLEAHQSCARWGGGRGTGRRAAWMGPARRTGAFRSREAGPAAALRGTGPTVPHPPGLGPWPTTQTRVHLQVPRRVDLGRVGSDDSCLLVFNARATTSPETPGPGLVAVTPMPSGPAAIYCTADFSRVNVATATLLPQPPLACPSPPPMAAECVHFSGMYMWYASVGLHLYNPTA